MMGREHDETQSTRQSRTRRTRRMHIVKIFLAVSMMLVICVAISAWRAEEQSWEQAETLDSQAAYQHFIETYPDGRYAEKARLKIEELDFKEAETQHTIRAYTHYVEKYPHGVYTEYAQLTIETLSIHPNRIVFDPAVQRVVE